LRANERDITGWPLALLGGSGPGAPKEFPAG
jgi:hypothetical protein